MVDPKITKSICIYKSKDGKFHMPTSKVYIQKDYKFPINNVLDFFQRLNNKNIHSIYLRGSIVFGSGIKNISDLDFFIITLRPLADFDRQLINNHMKKLNKKYPFITKFDIGYFTLNQILSMKENVLIKLTSVCIYGKDLKYRIKSPRPGRDITISLSLLENEIKKTKKEIKIGLYNKTNTPSMCIWIMKRIIRSGLEIVSKREGCFTRDLNECFKKFIKYYPDKKDDMQKALSLAIKPTTKTKLIKEVFYNMGDWLISEGKKLKLI